MKRGRKKTHGMKGTRFYRIWTSMKTRCYNKRHVYYKYYGGIGITVCDKWLSFEGFMEDMYESYKKHSKIYGEKNTSIDRINENEKYCKKNCEWSTQEKQNSHQRNRVRVLYKGKKYSIKDLAKKQNLRYGTLYNRLNLYSLPIEEAIKKQDRRGRKYHKKKIQK